MSAATEWKELLIGLTLAVLATAVLGLILWLIRRLFPRVCATIESWRGTRITSLRIQNLELLSAERITGLLITVVRVVRLAVVVLLITFYVPLVFSVFPGTRGYAGALLGYILTPLQAIWNGVVSYLPDLFTVLVVAVVTRYAIKLIRLIFTAIQKGTLRFSGFYPEWAEPTYKIVRFLVLALATVAVYPYIPGSSSPAFKGVSVFLGVLFSLGSAGAIANVMAGVVLTYTRAFQVGDYVKIGETTGTVIDKTLLVTRARTPKNEDVSIPNSLVLSSHMVNYSACARNEGVIVHTSVTIGYDAPWRTVHSLLIAAAHDTPEILKDPAPFVLQTALNDFYVAYQVNAYTNAATHLLRIYSDLHQNIQDKFNEAGVEIMSPHYTSVRDGNHIAIPDSYVPNTYETPAFRLFQAGGNGSGAR
ncbi:MAG TPA: mechanosensitive ion channel family protein [Bryobacteraceae bacterium]|nr:mechanosensitive ion channel family protein [Bryobacteraceae bacterium]